MAEPLLATVDGSPTVGLVVTVENRLYGRSHTNPGHQLLQIVGIGIASKEDTPKSSGLMNRIIRERRLVVTETLGFGLMRAVTNPPKTPAPTCHVTAAMLRGKRPSTADLRPPPFDPHAISDHDSLPQGAQALIGVTRGEGITSIVHSLVILGPDETQAVECIHRPDSGSHVGISPLSDVLGFYATQYAAEPEAAVGLFIPIDRQRNL